MIVLMEAANVPSNLPLIVLSQMSSPVKASENSITAS